MTAGYWWKSVTEASAPLTEQALRDTFAKIENERNTIAEERARRGFTVEQEVAVETPRMRYGANGDARAAEEKVLVCEKEPF